jgi:ABC-type lipoprotein export system ATPase subunit
MRTKPYSQGCALQEVLVIRDNLVKIYKVADLAVRPWQRLDLEVSHGEMIASVGAFGSCKSALLNIWVDLMFLVQASVS